MTVYTVYFSFILFVLLLILINSYFLISLRIEKYRNQKIDKRKNEIIETFKNIFEREVSAREYEIKEIKKVFNRKVDIEAFYLAVKEYEKETAYKKELKKLLEEVVDIDKVFKSGVVRKEYKRSYTLYLMSEFEIGNKKAGEFALKSLENNSVYVRNNALKVINKNHNIDLFMKALDRINSRKYHFNEKMLIDFLDDYNGEQDELSNHLYSKIDIYNKDLKKIIVAHFTNMNDGSKKTRDKMLEIIKNSDEKELTIASLRYFQVVVDNRAKPYIIEMMNHKDWAIRATVARMIFEYGDNQVKEKLKKGLEDSNYYVRANSASSFLKLEKKENIIEEALNNEDRFARDILLYSMNMEKMISLEEYEILSQEFIEEKAREGAVVI